MELGSSAWLAAVMDAINASDEYRERAAGWRWPLGLAFLDEAGERSRYAILDLRDGRCHGATVTDGEGYEQTAFRLTGAYPRWDRLLRHGVNPMRCLLLKDVAFEGDRLTSIRYLPAAQALLNAMGSVPAEIPVTTNPSAGGAVRSVRGTSEAG